MKRRERASHNQLRGLHRDGNSSSHSRCCSVLRCCLLFTLLAVVVTVILTVVVMVTVRYTASDIYHNRLTYAPSDTRLIPVSTALCEGLRLTVTEPLANCNATLYSLQYPIYPDGKDSVLFSLNPHIAPESHEHYHYYLYPGSTITLSACISSEHYAGISNFYLVKGYDSYKNWPLTPNLGNFVLDRCTGRRGESHQYAINDGDYYFFLFEGDTIEAVGLQVDVELNRTRYKIPAQGIRDSCTVLGSLYNSSCSVAVASGPHLLIVTPSNVTAANWAQGIGLDIACIPRVWMYIVFSVSILPVVFVTTVLVLYCICCHRNKGKPATGSIQTSTYDAISSLSHPLPPTNPHFQPQEPANNTWYDPPPPYRP